MYRFPSAQRQRRLEKCGIVANSNKPSEEWDSFLNLLCENSINLNQDTRTPFVGPSIPKEATLQLS
jgi:hypothetical protein